MSLCPLDSVSPAPLLLLSCHPAPGDTVSHTLMSEQGKSTVEMSDGSGCVHSATPHRACGALLSGFLLVILDAWKLLEKLKGAATTTPSSHFGNTLSDAQLQVEIFPLGSGILWGASLSFSLCLLQTVFHAPKNPVTGECYTGGWLWGFSLSRGTPGLLTQLL